MSELLDKLERARFTAVVRLRGESAAAAELLDNALIMEAGRGGAITVHCVMDSAGNPMDRELGELSRREAESLTEESAAGLLAGWARDAG